MKYDVGCLFVCFDMLAMRVRKNRIRLTLVAVLFIFFICLPVQDVKATELNLQPKEISEPALQLQEKSYLVKVKDTAISDCKSFYTWNNMLKLSLGTGVAAIFANTEADQTIRDSYQQHVRSSGLDHISKGAQLFGNGEIVLPALAGAVVLEKFIDGTSLTNSNLGTWGEKSLRSLLVGLPSVLILKKGLGASRPYTREDMDGGENRNSHYHPFKGDNGVSGHSFMGAVPLITAAKMTDNMYMKIPLYGLSALPALSRINDDSHYFSQAILGWWIAYLSTECIFGNEKDDSVIVAPLVALPNDPQVYGVSVMLKW